MKTMIVRNDIETW